MRKLLQIFSISALITSSVYAADVQVSATSKTYVDSGLAKKASITIVNALNQNLAEFQNRPAGFATAAQGALADTAVQPTGLATVATTGSYSDLVDSPAIPNLTGYATQAWVLSQGYSSGDGGLPATEENLNNLQAALLVHISDETNSHSVSKEQIGLSNVQNVDQTNANNLTSGTVNIARLPIGDSAMTVAAGNDPRFAAIENKVDAAALGSAAYVGVETFATAAQGTLADTAVQNITASGTGNVVTAVAKNTTDNNVTVTYGNAPPWQRLMRWAIV